MQQRGLRPVKARHHPYSARGTRLWHSLFHSVCGARHCTPVFSGVFHVWEGNKSPVRLAPPLYHPPTELRFTSSTQSFLIFLTLLKAPSTDVYITTMQMN